MTEFERPNSNIPPLDRPQILIGMAVTAVVLMAIARFIQWLGDVSLLSWHWDSETLLLGGGLVSALR